MRLSPARCGRRCRIQRSREGTSAQGALPRLVEAVAPIATLPPVARVGKVAMSLGSATHGCRGLVCGAYRV